MATRTREVIIPPLSWYLALLGDNQVAVAVVDLTRTSTTDLGEDDENCPRYRGSNVCSFPPPHWID